MILRPNLIRLVMGFGLYSNAVNLLLITVGGYTRETGAPFVESGPQTAPRLMDPLPPDIILTAIVISFAVGALMLIICYRVYLDHGTDNPQELPLDDDFTETGEAPPRGGGGRARATGGGTRHAPLTPAGRRPEDDLRGRARTDGRRRTPMNEPHPRHPGAVLHQRWSLALLNGWPRLERAIASSPAWASSSGLLAPRSTWTPHGVQVVIIGGWMAPWGIAFVADRLACIMLCLSTGLGTLVQLYSFWTVTSDAAALLLLPADAGPCCSASTGPSSPGTCSTCSWPTKSC